MGDTKSTLRNDGGREENAMIKIGNNNKHGTRSCRQRISNSTLTCSVELLFFLPHLQPPSSSSQPPSSSSQPPSLSSSTSIIVISTSIIVIFNLHHHTSGLTGLTWCHPAMMNFGIHRIVHRLGVGNTCSLICAPPVTLEVGLRTIPSVVSSFRYLSTNSIVPGPGSI